MNIESKLQTLGLTDAQANIYVSLLKLGKGSVKEIAQECGYHRTNIYDILEELKEEGIVSFYKEGNTSIYKPVEPEQLESLIQEKKEALEEALPELKDLFAYQKEEVEAEVFKGEEGMKKIFSNMLRESNEVFYGLNIKGQLREDLPEYAETFYRRWKKEDLLYRGIYSKEYTPATTFKGPAEIRYISKEYQTPVATHIYGNHVSIELWQPSLIAVQITSEDVAEAYKDYFTLLWNSANKEPVERPR